MIYTIVKETTTLETYSVASDTPENAIKKIEQDGESYYLIESETIEPEYVVVNVEKQWIFQNLKKPYTKYRKQYSPGSKQLTPEKKLLISVAKPVISYATYKLIGLFK